MDSPEQFTEHVVSSQDMHEYDSDTLPPAAITASVGDNSFRVSLFKLSFLFVSILIFPHLVVKHRMVAECQSSTNLTTNS